MNLERYEDIIELDYQVDCDLAIAELRALDKDNWRSEKTRHVIDLLGQKPEMRRDIDSFQHEVPTPELNNNSENCPTIKKCVQLFPDYQQARVQRINAGGFFEPHRDHMRGGEAFRVFIALNNTTRDKYAFFYEDRIIEFKPGVPYMINTAKVHGAMSFADETYHLLMTVRQTQESIKSLLKMVTFK